MATMTKTPDLGKATEIARTSYRGSEYSSDLYASWTTLYRSRGGELFLYLHGGGGIRAGFRRYVTREEAIDWLCEEELAHEDGVTRERAEAMIDAR